FRELGRNQAQCDSSLGRSGGRRPGIWPGAPVRLYHVLSPWFGLPLEPYRTIFGRRAVGRDYEITEALKMRYALIPHAGRWDTAQIATESNCWNEPLLGVYGGDFVGEDRQFVAAGQAGREGAVRRLEQEDLLLRLFNAESVSGGHHN